MLPLLLWAALVNGITVIAGARRHRPRCDRLTWLVAIALALLTVLGNHAVAKALALVEPGLVSVLLRTQALFVILLGWWLLHEAVTRRVIAGTLLAIGGCLIINGLSALPSSELVAGLLWAALAALCFALMQVVTRRVIHQIQPVLVNGLRLWLAVLLLLVWPNRLAGLDQLSGQVWLLTAAAALAGPIVSRLCIMWALRHITAAQCTLIALIGPVFAFSLGTLFFGTLPTPQELIGSLVILAGIALPLGEMIRAGFSDQGSAGRV